MYTVLCVSWWHSWHLATYIDSVEQECNAMHASCFVPYRYPGGIPELVTNTSKCQA